MKSHRWLSELDEKQIRKLTKFMDGLMNEVADMLNCQRPSEPMIAAWTKEFGDVEKEILLEAGEWIKFNADITGRFPPPKKFREAIYEATRTLRQHRTSEAVGCEKCDSTGLHFFRIKTEEGFISPQFNASCDCAFGKKHDIRTIDSIINQLGRENILLQRNAHDVAFYYSRIRYELNSAEWELYRKGELDKPAPENSDE